MTQKTMVIDISLDHLKEDEIALILGVLERDAKIQKQEDERKRRLRKSMIGERIPEKRLSVKIRTGEWMEEMTAPSRSMKRRGTEIVRASIRRKGSAKQTREANLSKPREETDATKQDEPVKNVEITSPHHEITKPEAEVKAEKSSSEMSSLRKTTIRRKKVTTPNQDKQVKFDTEKTKNFVYEQTSIDSMDGIPAARVDVKVIPKIVVQSDKTTEKEEDLDVAQPVEVTVITDDAPASAEPEAKPDNSGDFASSAKFESYHRPVERKLFEDEDQTGDDKADKEDKEKDKKESPKVVTKVRVIKRKGSSRRKVGKIFDDSSRDTLFNAPEENSQVEDVEKVVADKTVEAVIVSAADAAVATDSNVPDVPSTKREGNEQSETVQPITSIPRDDAYPEILVADAEKQVEDFDLMSSILGKVAKEYEKLVDEEKHEITSVADTEKHETRDSSEHKILDENVFDKTVTAEDLTAETEKHHAALVHDYPDSPEPKLELGLSEVLNTITEKYESMPTEVKEALTEIANDTQPLSFRDDIQETHQPDVVTVEPALKSKFQEPTAQELELRDQIAALAADNKPVEVLNDEKQIPEEYSYTQNIPTPIVENLIECVLEEAQITPKESEEEDKGEKHDDEEHKTDKPKKKVVKKRIIKKIKPEKTEEEQGSPKSETVKENDENVEGSPIDLSKLSRKKTVRRKVIRKAPPPSE